MLEKTEIIYYGICIFDLLTFFSEKFSASLKKIRITLRLIFLKYYYSDKITCITYMYSAFFLLFFFSQDLLIENWPKNPE